MCSNEQPVIITVVTVPDKVYRQVTGASKVQKRGVRESAWHLVLQPEASVGELGDYSSLPVACGVSLRNRVKRDYDGGSQIEGKELVFVPANELCRKCFAGLQVESHTVPGDTGEGVE